MPTSIAATKILYPPAYLADETIDLAQIEKYLPLVLSAIAGMVDVIGFLRLGLFTAHVTGNIVVIAALLVRGGMPNVAQLLAVPVFVVAVAAVGLIAKAANRRGPAVAWQLLLIQFVLLSCVLVFNIIYYPAVNPHGAMGGLAAMMVGDGAP